MANEIYEIGEEYYSFLCDVFEEDPNLFIPVYIKEDINDFNAYFTSFPSNHIVMYNTPIISSLDNSSNTIKMAFLHELTHAFTFFFKGIAGKISTFLLGDYANFPLSLHMLPFLQEGIAVYIESRSGEGRLNDPIFKENLIQAKLENKVLSYLDASGGRDIYPSSSMWYSYGGAFVEWVSDRYGEEKLVEFYKSIAKEVFSFPQNAYYSVFKSKLWDDWQLFLSSIDTPSSLSDDSILISKGLGYSNLVVYDEDVYLLSSSSSEVLKLGEDKKKTLFTLSSSQDLVISKEGNFLIPYRSDSLCYVALYSDNGRLLERYDNYYCGAFLDDKIVLLGSKDRVSWLDIVENGKVISTISLGYNVFSSEFVSGEDSIFWIISIEGKDFIASYRDGDSSIGLYNFPSNITISSLSYSDGVLSFSYATKGEDGEIGRYGEIALDRREIYLSSKFFNGGINYPVKVNESVYYVSSFFEYDFISKISERELEVEPIGEVKVTEFVPKGTPENKLTNAQSYNPLLSLMRGAIIPVASTSNIFYLSSSGLGATWYTTDPTEDLSITTTLGYNPLNEMGFSQFSLGYKDVGLSLATVFNEKVFGIEGNVYYSHSFVLFHEGEAIRVSDYLGFVKVESNHKFYNYFSLSYSNYRKKGMGRYRIKGLSFGIELWNLEPLLFLTFRLPSLLPFSSSPLDLGLPLTIQFRGNILNKELSSQITMNILTYEVQTAIRFLSLYFSHIDLVGKARVAYNIEKGSVDQSYSIVLTSAYAFEIGQIGQSGMIAGIEISYIPSSGFKTQLVLEINE